MADAPDTQQKHILLVEDEAIIALAQKKALTRNGYAVSVATSGEQAVTAVAADGSISLILMDIDLGPGIDGTEAATRILAVRDIPIVFLTSHSEQEMVDRVRGITRYGYVLKNSGEFVLLQAIEMAFELFRARRKAESGKALYRSVANLTGEIIVQHDLNGIWTFLSDRACEFYGKPREELLGRSFLEFVHPDDREITEGVMVEIVSSTRPSHRRINRQLTPSGWRTVEWNSEIVRANVGTATRFQATGRDITDYSELERRVDDQALILRGVAENIPGIVYQFEILPDRKQRFAFINEGIHDLAGVSAREVLSDATTLTSLVHPEDVPEYERAIDHSFRTLEPYDIRHRLRTATGESRWIESHATPQRLADGTVRLTGVAIDITQRMAAEEELVRSESNFRTLFEHATSGIMLADDWSSVVDCNETAARLLGYSRDELVGKNARELIPPADIDERALGDVMGAAKETSNPFELDGRYIRKDGSVIEAAVRLRFLDDLPGGASHIVSFNDVTARRAAEREARSLLEEKELLIREVHHRVKNDLNLVQAFASLQSDQATSEETRQSLEELIRRIGIMGRVYDELKATGDGRSVSLNALLASAVESLQQSFLPNGVTITLSASETTALHSLAAGIGLMTNELITNAVKYGFSTDANGEIRVQLQEQSDHTIDLVVADTGVGFPDRVVQNREFGYGLTIVETLAAQHGGSVSLKNTSPHGARVEIAGLRKPREPNDERP